MATEVILPRVDMDMTEGKIAHWYVKDGEAVRKGQVLFEIETDKATMEVDSPVDGVMHGIHGEIGVMMPVGRVVGWILAAGEAVPAPTTSEVTAALAEAPRAAVAVAASVAAPSTTRGVGSGDSADAPRLLRATPLARSLALQHGIDLSQIAGSGPDGRILGRDVQPSKATAAPGPLHDLHLHWSRRGTTTPLLLIHGFGADQGSWRPLIQQLPEALAVLAVDLPNHGKSAQCDIKTLHDLARAVLLRLDQEDVEECHVLGHSLGGGVALAMAELEPKRVRSLTLLAPAGLGPEINNNFIKGLVQAQDEVTLKQTLAALFHNAAGLTGSFVATAFQQLQAKDRRLALAAMAAQLMPEGRQAQSLREVLNGLRIPVQLIWGRNDQIIPAHHSLDAPAHVGLYQLPAVGHLPQVEASRLVASLVDCQIRAAA